MFHIEQSEIKKQKKFLVCIDLLLHVCENVSNWKIFRIKSGILEMLIKKSGITIIKIGGHVTYFLSDHGIGLLFFFLLCYLNFYSFQCHVFSYIITLKI